LKRKEEDKWRKIRLESRNEWKNTLRLEYMRGKSLTEDEENEVEDEEEQS
jgi:hypothetical protein